MGTSLVMFVLMAALYYSAELSMEIVDKLSRFLSASQFKAIQERKVEKDGVKNMWLQLSLDYVH